MRISLLLALAWIVSACSNSDPASPGARPWKKGALAGGGVTFEMPGIPYVTTSTKGTGADAIHEEKATCEYDSRAFEVRVLSGPFIAKDIERTPADQRALWARSFLGDWIHADRKHEVKEDGAWSLGSLPGHRIRVALPAQPPERTVPVFIWLHMAAWGDRAILVQFIATQAATESSMQRHRVEAIRDRFLASLKVK